MRTESKPNRYQCSGLYIWCRVWLECNRRSRTQRWTSCPWDCLDWTSDYSGLCIVRLMSQRCLRSINAVRIDSSILYKARVVNRPAHMMWVMLAFLYLRRSPPLPHPMSRTLIFEFELFLILLMTSAEMAMLAMDSDDSDWWPLRSTLRLTDDHTFDPIIKIPQMINRALLSGFDSLLLQIVVVIGHYGRQLVTLCCHL